VASRLLRDDELGYFMDMESLFNHPGWARLTKEIADEMKLAPEVTFATAKCWEDVQRAKDRYTALQTLVNLPNETQMKRAELEASRLSQIEEVNEL
jgi:hypothetical protein